MICWFCYWGWPKAVRDIYDAALNEVGEHVLHFGPTHIVWEDENFGNRSVDFCLAEIEKPNGIGGYSTEELAVVKRSLLELRNVPEAWRQEPDGYDDEHPEKFPPPQGVPWQVKRTNR